MVLSTVYEVTEILEKRGFFSATLCADFSDLLSPTSNHIPHYRLGYFNCICIFIKILFYAFAFTLFKPSVRRN